MCSVMHPHVPCNMTRWDVCSDAFTCAPATFIWTSAILTSRPCDVTRSDVYRDSCTCALRQDMFRCVPWRFDMYMATFMWTSAMLSSKPCDMTRSDVCRDSCTCVLWRDSFRCVPWLIHMHPARWIVEICAMTQWLVQTCTVTHPCALRHDWFDVLRRSFARVPATLII